MSSGLSSLVLSSEKENKNKYERRVSFIRTSDEEAPEVLRDDILSGILRAVISRSAVPFVVVGCFGERERDACHAISFSYINKT